MKSLKYTTRKRPTRAKSIDALTGAVEDKILLIDVPHKLVDEHIRSYKEYIYSLVKKLTLPELGVFVLLSHEIDYNTNNFNIDKENKAAMCNSLEISNERLLTLISSLCKKEVIMRKEKGKYVVSPKYVFRGTEENRMSLYVNIISVNQLNINNNCDITNTINNDISDSKLNNSK